MREMRVRVGFRSKREQKHTHLQALRHLQVSKVGTVLLDGANTHLSLDRFLPLNVLSLGETQHRRQGGQSGCRQAAYVKACKSGCE